MTKFKVGDAVQLKSGGPAMTVKRVELSLIHTQWFVPDGLTSNAFAPAMLIRTRRSKPKLDSDIIYLALNRARYRLEEAAEQLPEPTPDLGCPTYEALVAAMLAVRTLMAEIGRAMAAERR